MMGRKKDDFSYAMVISISCHIYNKDKMPLEPVCIPKLLWI